jgi:hypothetical protein
MCALLPMHSHSASAILSHAIAQLPYAAQPKDSIQILTMGGNAEIALQA